MNELSFEKLKNGCEIAVTKEHSFGTDAFLLADFAQVRHKDIVCDLGTGCGIIAILMKLRYEPKLVYGIDIQKQAIEQFEMSVERSQLQDIFPIHMDLKEIKTPAPLEKCDVVTCNPPYKAASAGIESSYDPQRIARHEILCDINDVCRAADRLLKFGGRLCLCNRPERLADVISAMKNNHIEPKSLRFVAKTPKDSPWLFLIEGRKGGKPFMNVLPQLYTCDGGAVSDELKSIYGHTEP
ncbi:MAG: tRNA1(Val) (adenine(37)-N6)-methyltransferase [Oscillospiraceae bacterium]